MNHKQNQIRKCDSLKCEIFHYTLVHLLIIISGGSENPGKGHTMESSIFLDESISDLLKFDTIPISQKARVAQKHLFLCLPIYWRCHCSRTSLQLAHGDVLDVKQQLCVTSQLCACSPENLLKLVLGLCHFMKSF